MFKLTIDTANHAFGDHWYDATTEVARILGDLAARLADPSTAPDHGLLRDANGNHVGAWDAKLGAAANAAPPREALQWIIEQAADAFTDNLDPTSAGEHERDTLHDLVCVADWCDAMGIDTTGIRGALPNDEVAAKILAWEPAPPVDPVSAALDLLAEFLENDPHSGATHDTAVATLAAARAKLGA